MWKMRRADKDNRIKYDKKFLKFLCVKKCINVSDYRYTVKQKEREGGQEEGVRVRLPKSVWFSFS